MKYSALYLALGAAACGGDLRPNPEPEQPAEVAFTTQDSDGSRRTRVHSPDPAAWVHFDFEASDAPVSASDPGWDLAFSRYKIKINGGVSGTGTVAVALFDARAFSGVSLAPASGYLVDAPDSEDLDAEPDLAFGQSDAWYSYEISSHTLTPRPRVYVVRTGAERYYKLAFLSYYDEAGSPGFVTFRWLEIGLEGAAQGLGTSTGGDK